MLTLLKLYQFWTKKINLNQPYGKLLTTFVSLRGKKDFHTIYIHGNTVLNSQTSITQNKYAGLSK